MIDIAILRADPDRVRENIRKKFQDNKLPLVDEALALDEKRRALQTEGDTLRASRNALSKKIGQLMREKKAQEAEEVKAQVNADAERLAAIETEAGEVSERLKAIMMRIPNFISADTPIGKNDTENVERERFLEPKVPDFEVPYHVDILERLGAIDLDSARRTSGQGFYYLIGDVARLHSAVLAYARDFMINKGFTYVIPPFMIRSDVVSGVMSFEEMERRIGNVVDRGVALKPGTTLRDLYEERIPYYERYADIVIDEAGKTPGSVVDELRNIIEGMMDKDSIRAIMEEQKKRLEEKDKRLAACEEEIRRLEEELRGLRKKIGAAGR